MSRARRENKDVEDVDEIHEYYNCRYVFASEASWRIFGLEIHHQTLPVERLSFHLPGEHTIVFDDEDTIDDVISRPINERSLFMAWMQCNKQYDNARNPFYSEFLGSVVWQRKDKMWTPRKSGFSIGRLYHVAPGCGERYYLRTLLNIVNGPKTYKDIETIDGVIHPTFKDACYSMGLLDDDQEYIYEITEASFWG